MYFQLFKPSAFLSQFVSFYWVMETCSSLFDNSPANRVVPNGSVNLFFHYGDVLKYRNQSTAESLHYQSMISGQVTEYFEVYHTGQSNFISVVFRPSGAAMFFDIPLNDLLNQHIDINALDSKNAKYICEQLHDTNDPLAKVKIIEEYLIRNYSEKNSYKNLRISSAVQKAIQTGGNISIDKLAQVSCLSHKQFDRIFTELVGVHPKQFTKITRLQNVFRLLSEVDNQNLLDVAFLAGYYDQAHFSKEFKQFTGYTPKQCLKQCKPTSDMYLEL